MPQHKRIKLILPIVNHDAVIAGSKKSKPANITPLGRAIFCQPRQIFRLSSLWALDPFPPGFHEPDHPCIPECYYNLLTTKQFIHF